MFRSLPVIRRNSIKLRLGARRIRGAIRLSRFCRMPVEERQCDDRMCPSRHSRRIVLIERSRIDGLGDGDH
jgi:hypothetical protein